MLFHASQTVAFVRVDLLLEQRSLCGQSFREDHALLEMDVVVGRSVYLYFKWNNKY